MSDAAPVKLLTVKEFAQQHGWSEWQVRDRVRYHGLPHLLFGRHIMIPEDAIERMLAQQRKDNLR